MGADFIFEYFELDFSRWLNSPLGIGIVMFITLIYGLGVKLWVEHSIENQVNLDRELEDFKSEFESTPEIYLLLPIQKLSNAGASFFIIFFFVGIFLTIWLPSMVGDVWFANLIVFTVGLIFSHVFAQTSLTLYMSALKTGARIKKLELMSDPILKNQSEN